MAPAESATAPAIRRRQRRHAEGVEFHMMRPRETDNSLQRGVGGAGAPSSSPPLHVGKSETPAPMPELNSAGPVGTRWSEQHSLVHGSRLGAVPSRTLYLHASGDDLSTIVRPYVRGTLESLDLESLSPLVESKATNEKAAITKL